MRRTPKKTRSSSKGLTPHTSARMGITAPEHKNPRRSSTPPPRRSSSRPLTPERHFQRLADVVPENDADDDADHCDQEPDTEEAFVLDTPLEMVTKYSLDWEAKTWRQEEIQVRTGACSVALVLCLF